MRSPSATESTKKWFIFMLSIPTALHGRSVSPRVPVDTARCPCVRQRRVSGPIWRAQGGHRKRQNVDIVHHGRTTVNHAIRLRLPRRCSRSRAVHPSRRPALAYPRRNARARAPGRPPPPPWPPRPAAARTVPFATVLGEFCSDRPVSFSRRRSYGRANYPAASDRAAVHTGGAIAAFMAAGPPPSMAPGDTFASLPRGSSGGARPNLFHRDQPPRSRCRGTARPPRNAAASRTASKRCAPALPSIAR